MILNFENITEDLTSEELWVLIPILTRGFKNHEKSNPIKAPEIVKAVNIFLESKSLKLKFNEPKLRKCCNFIRSNAIIPLIATSNGYYVSYDKSEIKLQIESLKERANSIYKCVNGMTVFLES